MKNKVAIITGASGEIGKAIVENLVKSGYNIVYHYNTHKNEEFLQKISKKVGVLAVKADLRKQQEIDNMVDQILKVFGKVDVIVNNAGASEPRLFIDETYKTILDNINLNLTAAIYLTNALLSSMEEGSSIVNISSIWGVYGGSTEVVYSSAKAGLIGFTKALSKEVGAMGIRVNAVAPGFIDTKMNSHITKEEKQDFIETSLCLPRLGLPKDIANLVDFLVSHKASYITGQVIGADGGFMG